jgi:hypothetical protein
MVGAERGLHPLIHTFDPRKILLYAGETQKGEECGLKYVI